MEQITDLNSQTSNNNNQISLKLTAIDKVGGIFCNACKVTVNNKKDFEQHYKGHDTNILYSCATCYKEYKTYSGYRSHCYSHVIKEQHECNICDKKFSKLFYLNEHRKRVHEKQYKCPPPCNKKFKTGYELKMHSLTHTINTSYDCKNCKDKIENLQTCVKHIEKHTIVQYTCPICDEIITDKISAREHFKKHFQEDELINIDEDTIYDETNESCTIGIACSVCNDTYVSKTQFDLHYKISHDSNVVYSCSICWKDHKVYSLFRDHYYDHMMKEVFKCVACNKTFPRLALLVLHVEAVHTSSEKSDKPFKCVQCGQAFGKHTWLKNHLQVAHGILYQICPETGCGKIFESPRALIIHQIEHKNDSENRCCKCGMYFKNLMECYKHIHVHKKKTYTCPICSKKYTEKHPLVVHATHHFQAIFHSCQSCDKMFTSRWRLVQHMKTHTDQGDHVCQYCGKKFTKKYSFQQHLNTHTGSSPFKCTLCSRTFNGDANWRKHLKKMHKITVKTMKVKRQFNDQDDDGMKTVRILAIANPDETVKTNNNNSKAVGLNVNEVIVKNLKAGKVIYVNTKNNLEKVNSGTSEELPKDLESIVYTLPQNNARAVTDLEENNPNILQNISIGDILLDNNYDNDKGPLEIIQLLQDDASILDENIETLCESNEQENTVDVPHASRANTLPREYGPDFNNPIGTFEYGNNQFDNIDNQFVTIDNQFVNIEDQVIDLDNQVLPHIYPHLTMTDPTVTEKAQFQTLTNVSYDNTIENYQINLDNSNSCNDWETSLTTKVYQNELPLVYQYWQ